MINGRFSARIVLILLAALLGFSGCGYIGAAVARQTLTDDDDDDTTVDPGLPAPVVTGVTPGTGTAFGGEIVTVTGSEFQPGATVVFGFLQATNVTVTSAFIIECKTPGFAPGQVPVIVNNPDGKSGTLNNGYIYLGPTPVITTVTPSSGSVAGGTLITVTGSNFSPNATVRVGGTAATSVNVSSATQFTAVVPAGVLGPADVEITNVDLQSFALTGGFTYQGAAPTVTSVSPTTGPPAGGTLITITGTNFLPGATVTVGGTAATGVSVVSATSITGTTPAGTGAASVTVTNIDALSGSLPSAFTYTGTGATVTSVNPALGPVAGGTLVTITGSNFASGASITFGGTAASTTTFVNATTYTAVTPAGTAGPANVEVTNPSASPGTLVNGFTYQGGTPTITNVNPGAGTIAGGTLVTVTGTNFVTGATVEFGGVVATGITVVSTTSITCTTPAGTIGPVTVDLNNGDLQTATLAAGYIYQGATPTLTGVTPGVGPLAGGTSVTLTGTNFFAGATVTIGGSAAGSVTLVSASTITCTSPSGTQGPANVVVTNVDLQNASIPGGFIFQGPAPTVTSVQAPAAGPIAGGTTITIVGTNFVAGATVTVGGSAAGSVNVLSATNISCVTPAGAIGPATVQVTNVDTLSGSLAAAYTYQGGLPTVTAVSPSTGPLGGGTFVTITGTNFAAGATVNFGASPGTSVTVVSATTITATTPAGSGPVTVTVTNVDTQFGTLSNGFTYSGTSATVTSVSPAVGPTAGSTLVTITGTNFVTGATITFGGATATSPTFVNSTTYTAVTPAGTAGPANVVLTNPSASPGTLVNGFTYQGGTPTITNVNPGAGTIAGGTLVTVTGTNFVTGATVEFGGVVATGITVVSTTSITCTTPAGTIGPVTVDLNNGDLQTATLASGYIYQGATPTLSGVTPGVGPLAGGTSVTLTGTNFFAGATVTIGGSAAGSVTLVSASTITCTTPPGTQGPANVVVTNVDLQNASIPGGFIFQGPAPTVTSVQAPAAGPIAGGTTITIVGTNFVAGATVTVGGSAAGSVNVLSATNISCVTPAGAIGPATVQVTNVDTLSGSLAAAYTYQGGVPTVTGVNPGTGPTGGGTFVTVTGTNFAAGATVTFGAGSATGVSVVSASQITCVTPSGTGAVTVTVTNVDTQFGALASAYSYSGTSATVTSVNPAVGPTAGSTLVTITGTNFVTGATITFGGATATSPTFVNSTTYTAVTPAGTAGPANVVLTNPSASPGTLVNGFTYQGGTPTITNVNPGAGTIAGGTLVTVTGTNFVTGATVEFGGVVATGITVVSATSITCTTPAGTIGPVTVDLNNGDLQTATLASGYIYQGATPTLTNVTPGAGPLAGGTSITLTGTNFVAGATVTVGGGSATGVTVVSASTLTCTTPAGTQGPATVVVTNVDTQNATLAAGYIFQGPAPTLTGVSPAAGPLAGGTTVTLTGTNFVNGATVTFGGALATAVNVVSATQITCTNPAGTIGSAGVTVTNVDTLSATLANGYTYQGSTPTVTAVSPSSGPLGGGTFVTVTGTNFATGATVDFGGSLATGVAVVSGTQITCTTPSGTGPVTVTVTNVDTLFGSLAAGFTFAGTPATVSSVNPATGGIAGGTLTTITGSNFAAGATVRFGAGTAGSVNVVSGTTITCTTPAGPIGPANVEVNNPFSSPGTLVNGFTYQGATPTLTNVNPGAGPIAGGTSVTLTGTNFAAGATVQFGGVQATGVTVVSGTQITCTTPSGTFGPVSVAVTNVDLQSATLPSGYIYQGAAPTLTNVTPGAGPLAGGTALTLTGTNFVAGATVTVGGSNAASVTVVSASTITCTAPSGTQGPATVVVTNTDTQNATLAGGYIYQGPAPTLSSVSPAAGPLAGGTTVTLTGTNFVAGATVTFGGNPATGVNVVSGTQITCATPAGTIGSTNVTVTNVDTLFATLSNGYLYQGGNPTVTSVSPGSGPLGGGTFVTVTGTNFFAGATVDFGGSLATSVAVVSGTQITCSTPSGTGLVTVTVTNVDTLFGSLPGGFNYAGTPATVSSITPSSGPVAGGTAVSITGTNFVSGASVTIGGFSASSISIVSATLITCTTPAGTAGPANVEVTNPSSAPGTLVGGYTYLGPPPTLGSVNPSSGPTAGGTNVTLTGTNFVSGASVTFGGNAASSINVASSTTITCVTPAGAAGPVAVVVTNPDTQQATQPTGFSYSSGGPPTVSSVSPSSGAAAGGSPVTITGTNFLAGATVDFGGVQATNVVVGSGNLITATLPAHQPAVVTVRVTNTDGQFGSQSGAFTFQGPPALNAVTPSSGSAAGGTRVVLYGTGFAAGATVTFAGVQAFETVVSLDGTELAVVTPPGSTGTVSVVVTNPAGTPTTGGQVSTLLSAYTYVTAGTDPTIGLLNPAVGPTSGGNFITITGNNFQTSGTTNVHFGTGAGSSVNVLDSQTVVVRVPGRSAGAVAVSIVNPNGLSVTKLDAYTYEAGSTPPAFGGVGIARALGGRAIELSWSAASDNGTPGSKMRYRVYVATSSGGQNFTAPDFTTDPGVTRFTVGGRSPGATYYFVVRAVDELGNEDSNTVERSATTTSAAAATPWPADKSMGTARRRHTATLLADGRVLVVGGNNGGSLSSVEIYDPALGVWSNTGSLNTARERHTAVLLGDGKVLVAGGLQSGVPTTVLSSCELWNPSTGTWTGTSGMSGARMDHTATLLRDGRVLVAGGDNLGARNSSELYNVSTGTWTNTFNTMASARARHTATLLASGLVLVTGGDNSGPLKVAELFDPTFNAWSTGGTMNGSRRRHTATRLRDGRVLVVGGDGGGPVATAELYDPGKGSWTNAASMASGRMAHTATLVPDGRVVVACGQGAAGSINGTEAYDPVAGTWSSTSTMGLGGRLEHTATLMATGRILAVGGDSAGASALSFRFDPALGAGTWYSVGSLTTARANHNAVLLPDGRVLVVAGDSGGATPSPLTNAELYDPQRQSWVGGGDDATKRTRRGAALLTDGRVLLAAGDRGSGLSDDCALYRPDAGSFTITTDSGPDRVGPMTVLLRSGRVLMMGGDGGLNALDHVERYDATSGNWVNRTKMNDARRRFAVAVLENGKVLAAGGESLSALNRAELYDPSADSWTATSSTMTTSRRHHTATLLPGGRVLIAAGHNTGFLNSAELYDPTSSTFTSTGSLASGRRDHTATLLADGRVLAVGGRNALSGLTSAELYDPAAAAWSGTGSLANRREGHAATLLPDGRVLVTGGQGTTTLASCELYDPGKAFADEWRPHIIAVHGNSTFPATLPYSTNVTIDGDRLRGMGESGGGASNASAGDAPVAMLVGPIGGEGGRSHTGAGRTFLLPATAFADGKTLLFRTPSSATIGKGYYMLRIVTNGVPSVARIIHLP